MKNHPHSGPAKQTNCHVITGAPCSGKTSVVEGLAQRGYKVVPEAARIFIDSQLGRGQTLEEIKSDILSFERNILLEKVRIENSLPDSPVIFLDRAIPDSIAYFQMEGLDCTEPLAYSRMLRYKTIFLFDRLVFEKDAVRSENQSQATRIERLLEKCYLDLGYPIIRVPVLTINERIDYVLSHATVKA